MYIKDTSYGYAVYKCGRRISPEFTTYDEAINWINEQK